MTSQLTLTSYVGYRKDDSPTSVREIPKNVFGILGQPAPRGVLYALYGANGAREGLGTLYPELYKAQQLLRTVRMTAQTKADNLNRVGLAEGDLLLKDTNCINLSRIRSDLRQLIRQRWVGFCKKKRLPEDEWEDRFPTDPTNHPELITRLQAEPE